jgi:hypothetical protein
VREKEKEGKRRREKVREGRKKGKKKERRKRNNETIDDVIIRNFLMKMTLKMFQIALPRFTFTFTLTLFLTQLLRRRQSLKAEARLTQQLSYFQKFLQNKMIIIFIS